MTKLTSVFGILAAVTAIALTTQRASAQGTPLAPVIVNPPTAPKDITPSSALLPSDSAVALCKNGTWIYGSGSPADCIQRGGLLVAMPKRTTPPSALAAAAAVSASVIAPSRVALAPPATATMQCKDGTFLYDAPSADRCVNNGGLAAIFTRPTPAPARPTRP